MAGKEENEKQKKTRKEVNISRKNCWQGGEKRREKIKKNERCSSKYHGWEGKKRRKNEGKQQGRGMFGQKIN